MTPNVRFAPTPLDVCVVVTGGSEQLVRAQLSAGKVDAHVRWLQSEQDCPLNLALIHVAEGILLPARWLERLLSVCSDLTDQAVAVFCERSELMPVRAGDSLHALSSDIDALCFALAPRTLYAARFAQAPLMFVPSALREQFSDAALDQMLLFCGMFVCFGK